MRVECHHELYLAGHSFHACDGGPRLDSADFPTAKEPLLMQTILQSY